jgi:hypothetical protein
MSDKREVMLRKIKEYRKKVGTPKGDNIGGTPLRGENGPSKDAPSTTPYTGPNIVAGTGAGAPINEGEYPHVY